MAFGREALLCLNDELLGVCCRTPRVDLDPLVGLQILVVLEEVLNLLARVFGDVGELRGPADKA